jgi:hypothetical protein
MLRKTDVSDPGVTQEILLDNIPFYLKKNFIN